DDGLDFHHIWQTPVPRGCDGPRCASALKVVSLFAVLRDVESFDFFFLAHSQADCKVDEFKEHQRPNECEPPGDDHADQLIADLPPIPIQPSDWLIGAKNRIDGGLREDSGEKSADGAPCAVNSESVERVIVPEN